MFVKSTLFLNMPNNPKIYSVLVAYNSTKKELSGVVKVLLKQTGFLVICNNSKTDLIYSHPKIKVLNFGDNLGIAKAQSLGMECAFSSGADFVLQMDQDSLPDQNMVEFLYESYLELVVANYNIGLICPLSYDRDTKKFNSAKFNKSSSQKTKLEKDFNDVVFVGLALSSGSLIPRKSFQAIGGMMNELFIDLVDFEYCWRLQANGFLIARNNKARIAHKIGEGRRSIMKIFDIAVPAPIRHYYVFRNVLYLFNRSYVPMNWKLRSILKMTFKILLYPLILNNGTQRFKFMLLGIKDGITKKMCRIDVNN